jgi:hypothetical protein
MSNKLTRKSLAFGAMVALASSVIAGAPAQAAGEVVFAPNTGTSYNTLVTEQISLRASLAPGQVASNISQLKYKVDSAVANSVWINTGNAVAAPVIGGVASTTSFVVAATTPSATSANIITLKLASSTAATATTSVTVTAFLDSNGDNLLTAGEFEQARTVKFVKYSEVVPTVAFSSTPAVGDSTLKSTVALADINIEQLTAASYLAAFTATTVSGGTAFTAVADVQVASGAATSAALSRTLIAGDVVTVQAKYGTELLGTAASVTVAARTIATVTGAEVVSANAVAGFARLNSAYSVKGSVKSSATGTPGVAGVPVTAAISVTGATLATGVTLSINGTVYNGTTALPTALALTSDANGEVLVNLIPSGFAATNSVTVTFTAQNIVATAVTTVQQSPAYTLGDSQDDTASANRAIARGGSISFNLEVKDQFGSAITGSSRIATTVSGGTTIATAYTAVADGKATVTVKDTQTSTNNAVTVTFALETQNSATLNWAASNISGFGLANPAASAAVTVAVSATAPGFTNAPAPATGTKFTGTVSPNALSAITAANAGTSNGVSLLNNATGLSTAVAGQRVTISGTGLLFRVGTKNYNDTVTLFSGAAGAFAVTVFGTTAGDSVVTLVTGTTTVTATITFAAGPVALVTLAAPAQAQVGQALDVVITTTDKWGNAQASAANGTGSLSLTSTGTGYFASAAPVTNAAGKATVKYIVGTADIGTAFMSATLEQGATDVTAARSVEFGLTDGDVLAGGKRIFVSAEFAKGRTVSVSINGKRVYSKVQTTDNAVELAFTQRRAGTYTVTVRISGGITFTEKVTVR